MEIFTTIILFLILGAISTVGFMVKDAAKIPRSLIVENSKAKNEKDIQRESYFREISGSKLDSTFDDWIRLITELDKFKEKFSGKSGEKKLNDMIKSTLMYGSERTVHIVAIMMQRLYKNGSLENSVKVEFGKEKDNSLENFELMFLISFLICSLKFDFSGYSIEPKDIIKTKINDYGDNVDIINKAYDNVKSMIN